VIERNAKDKPVMKYSDILPFPFLPPVIFFSSYLPRRLRRETHCWKPTFTIKQILLAAQDLLDNPNNDDPAYREPHDMLRRSVAEYEARVRLEARRC
jgi:ubiquitin-protein ligase